MKIEPFLFPAMVAAAVASIWVAFRRPAQPATGVEGVATIPAPVLPEFMLPANPVLQSYSPPTRYSPPGSLHLGPINTLQYPADLTAADAIGAAPDSPGQATSCGCGCG